MVARVQILMGTYNGAAYLEDQLTSIAAQEGVDWQLRASDDGSTDSTLSVLDRFGRTVGADRVLRTAGPGCGVARNYLGLISKATPDRFVALADQDDVWARGRLALACARLGCADDPIPKLYASRTWITGADVALIRGVSPKLRRHPGFANALVQNVFGGNTIVMNPAAVRLVQSTAPDQTTVAYHDWWLYILLAGAGAELIFDLTPTVYYRQHGENVLGSAGGLGAWRSRLQGVRAGLYRQWIQSNLSALEANRSLLTTSNARRLDTFRAALRAPAPLKGYALWSAGVHRQSIGSALGLAGAALVGGL